MSQAQTQVMVYRFDNFYLDASNRRLLRDGAPVAWTDDDAGTRPLPGVSPAFSGP